MGKLIYTALGSVDGYFEDAEGRFDWAEPDEEVHTFVNDLERPIGTYLYGRRMYETMLYWETVDTPGQPAVYGDYAGIWRAAEKVVYSRTLADADEREDPYRREFDPEAVRQLKRSSTADLAVGGGDLAGQAIGAGLVDEVHLFLSPIVIGGASARCPTGYARNSNCSMSAASSAASSTSATACATPDDHGGVTGESGLGGQLLAEGPSDQTWSGTTRVAERGEPSSHPRSRARRPRRRQRRRRRGGRRSEGIEAALVDPPVGERREQGAANAALRVRREARARRKAGLHAHVRPASAGERGAGGARPGDPRGDGDGVAGQAAQAVGQDAHGRGERGDGQERAACHHEQPHGQRPRRDVERGERAGCRRASAAAEAP